MEELLPKVDNWFDFLSVHQEMISDDIRIDSYYSAIQKIVRHNDVVVDVGAGTGLLGFFSILAGAKKVFAIESRSIIKVAREIAKRNGWADKIIFINDDSRNVTLPEKADVVVSEIIGHCLMDENMLDSIIDAKSRFMKPTGKMIPEAATIIFAPSENEEFSDDLSFWSGKIKGIDLSGSLNRAVNTLYVSQLSKNDLLARPKYFKKFNLYEMKKVLIRGKNEFKATRDGILHGIAGWFDIRLNNEYDIGITTGPYNPPTHWGCTFFPIKDCLNIQKNDLINFNCKCYSTGLSTAWEWSVEVKRDSVTIHNSFQSTELY